MSGLHTGDGRLGKNVRKGDGPNTSRLQQTLNFFDSRLHGLVADNQRGRAERLCDGADFVQAAELCDALSILCVLRHFFFVPFFIP